MPAWLTFSTAPSRPAPSPRATPLASTCVLAGDPGARVFGLEDGVRLEVRWCQVAPGLRRGSGVSGMAMSLKF